MVGRAACKNPFLFTQINEFLNTGAYQEISDKERLAYLIKYLHYAKNYPTIKFANIKMQAMNFTKGMHGSKKFRIELMKVKTREELQLLMAENIADNSLTESG